MGVFYGARAGEASRFCMAAGRTCYNCRHFAQGIESARDAGRSRPRASCVLIDRLPGSVVAGSHTGK